MNQSFSAGRNYTIFGLLCALCAIVVWLLWGVPFLLASLIGIPLGYTGKSKGDTKWGNITIILNVLISIIIILYLVYRLRQPW